MPSFTQQALGSVVFIYVDDDRGNLVENGTGFLVAVQSDVKGWGQTFVVTARHVIIKEGQFHFDQIYVRINRRDGGSDVQTVRLDEQYADRLHLHPDVSVDLAVIQIGIDETIYDCTFIDSRMIMSREVMRNEEVEIGDEVYFLGLFRPYIGESRNYPVARFGRISLITPERIPWKNWGMIEAMLIETQSFGGNSGAPVFLRLGPTRPENGAITMRERTLLFGILKGSFFESLGAENPEQMLDAAATDSVANRQNFGISAVVPGYKLLDVLLGRELRERMARGMTRWQQESPTTTPELPEQ